MAEGSQYNLKVGRLYNDNRYEVITQLGAGSTSTVWAVKDLKPEAGRSRLAIKVLNDDYHTSSELAILRYLKTFDPEHPGYNYVLKLYNSFKIGDGDKTYLCLVVDFVGPSLDDVRKKIGGVLSVQMAKQYFKQLLLALEYSHAAGVIHTDIKMDNILISVVSKDVCLCDWGEATRTSEISTPETVQPEGLRSPEVLLLAKPLWSTAIDIWNFGALLFEAVEKGHMFSGRDEHGNHHPEKHLQEIVRVFGALPQSLLDQAAPEIVDSLEIDSCKPVDLDVGLNYNPPDTKRGAALKKVLMEVMVIDPARRPTAIQLGDNVWFRAD